MAVSQYLTCFLASLHPSLLFNFNLYWHHRHAEIYIIFHAQSWAQLAGQSWAAEFRSTIISRPRNKPCQVCNYSLRNLFICNCFRMAPISFNVLTTIVDANITLVRIGRLWQSRGFFARFDHFTQWLELYMIVTHQILSPSYRSYDATKTTSWASTCFNKLF